MILGINKDITLKLFLHYVHDYLQHNLFLVQKTLFKESFSVLRKSTIRYTVQGVIHF